MAKQYFVTNLGDVTDLIWVNLHALGVARLEKKNHQWRDQIDFRVKMPGNCIHTTCDVS